ncbi:MAG: mechanosensitive ion channel family protein [Ruminococcus sp.]
MERILDKIMDFAGKILPNLIVVAIILVVGFFLTKLLVKVIKNILDKSKMDFSLEKFILNTVRIACYILLVLTALSQLGISTTGLIAFFSASAAAIVLALKDSLSNIACGIILLFSRPFVTGDVIEMGEDRCTVLQIDLMHTKVLTYDHRCIMIPNSVISSKEVVNFTAEPYRRVDITVPVAYDEDIEKVKMVIKDAVTKNKMVLNTPEPPFVRVDSFGESSMNFLVKVWAKTDDYWDVYHDMYEEIKTALDKSNITIPYKQIDVHMVEER